MEDRRLTWRRSVIAGDIIPNSFVGTFDGEDVGAISMVGEGLPGHGAWDWRLTYHGMFCSFLPSLGARKAGNLATKQEAADEVTRWWWIVYGEMQAAGEDWRDYIGRGAVRRSA